MGNNPGAGFMYGEGKTEQEAMENLRSKVEARGGRIRCDSFGVCYTTDANGVNFRIHLTRLATNDGRSYWSATQGVTIL